MIEERSLARAIGAALVLLAGVVATPVLLATQFGWPLPRTAPAWDEITAGLTQSVSDEIILNVFAVAVWVVWFIFAVTVVEEIIAVFRGTNHRLVAVGPMQVFVASLVGAIVLALPTNSRVDATSPQYSLAVAVQTVSTAPPLIEVTPAEPAIVETRAADTDSYTVVHRDTLWSIATRYLGDGTRWQEIWTLNKEAKQADGRVFTNPARIHPGWTIQLPPEAKVLDVSNDQPSVAAPPSEELPPEDSAEPSSAPEADLEPVAPLVPGVQVAPDAEVAVPGPVVDTMPIATADRTDVPSSTSGGITLASGGLVGATFASGIGAALVTARLRRRRLHVPVAPGAGDPMVDPLLTDAVRRLRSADLAHKAEVGEIDDELPARAHRPGTVTVAISDDEEQAVEATSLGGLSINTVDDLDHARAVILGFIANLPPEDAEVVIVGEALAAQLLGQQKSFPGLRIELDGDSVLAEADTDILTRTRLLAEGDYVDIDDFRRAHPIESIPARLIVMPSSDPQLVGRARATAKAAAHLGVGVIIIQGDDQSAGISSSDDAASVIAENEATLTERSAARVRLSQQEARDLTAVVEAARVDLHDIELVTTMERQGAENSLSNEESDLIEPSLRRVELRLFGPSRVLIDGIEPKRAVRRQVRELMSFLALRTHGATADIAGAAIWPEANQRRAQQRIRNLHGSANTDLRALTGLEGNFIERAGERYRLNPQLIDCDWWRFERTIAVSGNDVERLQQAMSEYEGSVAEGSDWLWIEVVREDAQRRMLSACSQVAKLMSEKDDFASACAALERACAVDPYNEAVHRELMTVQAKLGRLADLERTYTLLEERLSNSLGVQVSPQTVQLFDELMAKELKQVQRSR